MVTKDDIKLPPLHYDELPESDDLIPAMHNYARKAIKADRQRRSELVKVSSDDNSLTIAYMCGYRDGKRSTTPDATLIAAAPELLEALQNMVRLYYGEDRQNQAGQYARAAVAAITKALGEQND